MKNKTLLFIALTMLWYFPATSQIVNGGFENWKTDTTNFPGYLTIPASTYWYQDPIDWTSSNSISAMSVAGGFEFVQQSNDAAAGTSAMYLKTDTIAPVNMGPLGMKTLTLPGFALNGNFSIDISNLISGLNVTPMAIKGAGQAFTQKLAKFKGKYKYAPVLNPATSSYDTCLMWATLRKGTVVVAEAIFKSNVSTGGNYADFEATFKYQNCETPDTLVILVAASVPNIGGLLSGNSNLVRGSELLVDALDYEVLTSYAPVARADADTTDKNTAILINAGANDFDCDDVVNGLGFSITTQPMHGTVTPDVNVQFTYTPGNNFVGNDTFTYTLNDGTNTSDPAQVVVVVRDPNGIDEASLLPLLVFPVPAASQLSLHFNNPGYTTAKVVNLVGQVVATYTLNGNLNTLPLAELANGMYAVQVLSNKNEIIALSRFTVNR